MLAQKIALELFESEAIRIANATIPKDWLRAPEVTEDRKVSVNAPVVSEWLP
jgi:hypothetical protein